MIKILNSGTLKRFCDVIILHLTCLQFKQYLKCKSTAVLNIGTAVIQLQAFSANIHYKCKMTFQTQYERIFCLFLLHQLAG